MPQPPNSLLTLIRALPPWAEFAVVIAVAFGWFIFASFESAVRASYTWDYGAARLFGLPLFEIALAVPLTVFLNLRGWRLRDLGFDRVRPSDGGEALVLLAAAYAATLALWFAVPASTREAVAFNPTVDAGGLNPALVVFVSVVNAAFEEAFVCAYVVSAWRGPSMWNAIIASAAIRTSYHLYQGPLALVSAAPFGLIFAWAYATRGRLWSLIAAHALADIAALLSYGVT